MAAPVPAVMNRTGRPTATILTFPPEKGALHAAETTPHAAPLNWLQAAVKVSGELKINTSIFRF